MIFFIFTFYRENKFLIGQSRKCFAVKPGFEELKKEVNKYYIFIQTSNFSTLANQDLATKDINYVITDLSF